MSSIDLPLPSIRYKGQLHKGFYNIGLLTFHTNTGEFSPLIQTSAIVETWGRCTLINVDLTPRTCEPHRTVTAECTRGVYARTAMVTW